MCRKIQYDGESDKFCKIFWELNKALFYKEQWIYKLKTFFIIKLLICSLWILHTFRTTY